MKFPFNGVTCAYNLYTNTPKTIRRRSSDNYERYLPFIIDRCLANSICVISRSDSSVFNLKKTKYRKYTFNGEYIYIYISRKFSIAANRLHRYGSIFPNCICNFENILRHFTFVVRLGFQLQIAYNGSVIMIGFK